MACPASQREHLCRSFSQVIPHTNILFAGTLGSESWVAKRTNKFPRAGEVREIFVICLSVFRVKKNRFRKVSFCTTNSSTLSFVQIGAGSLSKPCLLGSLADGPPYKKLNGY